MELQHLRSFLEVSRELSFTRAARNLNYAQSTVTAQIQQLEASLGVELFHRQGRSIVLTGSGARLRPMAECIVVLADHAYREVAPGAGRQSRPGRVTLRDSGSREVGLGTVGLGTVGRGGPRRQSPGRRRGGARAG